MPRIKIEDLPIMENLDKEEQKGIFGGISLGGGFSFGGFKYPKTGGTEGSVKGSGTDFPRP